MLKKMRTYINLGILVVFAIAFIYFLVVAIIGIFNKPQEKLVDISNISKYTTEKGTVIKDYNLFCSLQNATENIIQYLMDKKYTEAYSILTKEMMNKYIKGDFENKVPSYVDKNFVSKDYDDIFENGSNLLKAYDINNDNYICETRNASGQSTYIGIRLNRLKNTYTVFYLDI